MVLISPPEGWVFTEEPSQPEANDPGIKESLSPSPNGDSAVGRRGPPVTRQIPLEPPAVSPPPVQPPVSAAKASPVVAPAVLLPGVAAASVLEPEPAPAQPVAAAAESPGFTPFELPDVVAGQTFLTSLTNSLWGRVAVLAVSGLLGLAGMLTVWTLVFHRHGDRKAGDEAVRTEASDPPPKEVNVRPKTAPAQFDRRWLPEKTALIVDLRLSKLANKQQEGQPRALDALAYLCAWWQPSSQVLLTGLNLGPEQIRRLTWISTKLTDCAGQCVVVVELDEGIDAAKQLPLGDSVDLGANLVARRPQGGPWRRPLLAINPHTIVTGSEETLRQLIARGGDGELASEPMERLLKKFSPGGDLAVMVDLSQARTAAWKFPTNLLDVWPPGKTCWHVLCETPLALGLSVQSTGQRRCELGLVCDGETMAEKIRADVEKLVPAMIRALPAHIAALASALPPGKFAPEVAGQYRQLLDDLLASLRAARCDTVDGIVWLHFSWGEPGLLVSAAATIENSSAIRADWLATARAVDEGNHRGLLGALLKFAKKQNPPQFPEGAVSGSPMLDPQTRLSWIAELLPYLGHEDWHIERGNDWNSAQNHAVASSLLAEVVNPALGPGKAPSGYPVTHYVGVGGVGDGAAQLPADDPRAGVFGYGRQTRQQDLVRGGANTIAVLGVQDHCGPWAQGGPATVRPLTQRPYINGPDGFGSGQVDGMVAGMADGSARFLSKNIDPHVLEQLATVRGGAEVDMAAIDSKPPEEPVKPQPIPGPNPPPVANANPLKATDDKPKPPPDPKLLAKLNLPIMKISLPNMPLAEAVQFISAMSALPVSFDPDAMEELGVSLHDPVSVETTGATIGGALEKIAAKRNMASVVVNGQILLTSTADYRENLRQTRYSVGDLTGNDAQATADLAAMLQRLVVPESWQGSGGRGTMEVTPDVLRVTQTGNVHYQIIVFCERLRVARGLPTRSRWDPKKFVLATRTDRAKPILGQMAGVNVNVPWTLLSIVDRFKQPPGTEIFIDRPALAAAGISDNAAGKFELKADKFSQGEALRQLLDSLGLAWRAVDATTLQITTQKALAARMELEFYPVGKALAGGSPAALIERIKAGLHGAVWSERGLGGVIFFDPPSQCLIVLQSQPVQMAIEAALGE